MSTSYTISVEDLSTNELIVPTVVKKKQQDEKKPSSSKKSQGRQERNFDKSITLDTKGCEWN